MPKYLRTNNLPGHLEVLIVVNLDLVATGVLNVIVVVGIVVLLLLFVLQVVLVLLAHNLDSLL